MAEDCLLPHCRRVAIGAYLRELRYRVVRIHRRNVIAQMTRHTVTIKSVVDPTLVAGGAGCRSVASGQRELRICRVVETFLLPGCC